MNSLWRKKKALTALAVVGGAIALNQNIGRTQTTNPSPSLSPTATPTSATTSASGLSDYIFRFNSGISNVFLTNMTFPNQQPLDLGACTVNEKINGPLYCAVNCRNESVCLLDLTGPSGSNVQDVLEKVSEVPSTSSTATPSATATAGSAASGAFGFVMRGTSSSGAGNRAEAYNYTGH